MSWISPRTWVAGEKPSAATLNAHIRDQLNALGDAWETSTATWASTGTAPAIGNGSLAVRSRQIGQTVDVDVRITMGSSTTYGTGNYTIGGLPAGVHGRTVLRGFAYDSSAGAYWPIHMTLSNGGTSGNIRPLPTTAGNQLANVTPSVPFTFADGDLIVIADRYEAA